MRFMRRGTSRTIKTLQSIPLRIESGSASGSLAITAQARRRS
jgi:hypothetical protein